MSTLGKVTILHKIFLTGAEIKSQKPYAPLPEQMEAGLYEFDLLSILDDTEENAPPDACYVPYLWTYQYADASGTYFKVINMSDQTPLCVSSLKGDVTATCWYAYSVPGTPSYWISAYGFSEASGNTFMGVINEVEPAEAFQNGSVCVETSGALITFKNIVQGEAFARWEGTNENWTHQGNALLAGLQESGLAFVFYGNVLMGNDEGDDKPDIIDPDPKLKHDWIHPLDIVSEEIERMEKLNTIIHYMIEKGLWPPRPQKTKPGKVVTVSRKVETAFNRKADKIVASLQRTTERTIRDIAKAKSRINAPNK